MKTVLFGHGHFGEAVLRRMLKNSEEIVGIVVPEKKDDQLTLAGREQKICVLVFDDTLFLDTYKRLGHHLNIFANFPKIVSKEILYLPPLHTIAFHPSLLPLHRGRNALNWAIISGEKKTGVTVFYPDQGIDTGNILLQKECEIAEDDTVSILYRRAIFPLGIDALEEAVYRIGRDTASKTLQAGTSSYEKPLTEENTAIDWTKTSKEVYNFIRGCDRNPGAWTIIHGKKVFLYDTAIIPFSGKAGEINVHDLGIIIACQNDAIIIKTIKEGDIIMPAREWVKSITGDTSWKTFFGKEKETCFL